jgi:hypothetical protein
VDEFLRLLRSVTETLAANFLQLAQVAYLFGYLGFSPAPAGLLPALSELALTRKSL